MYDGVLNQFAHSKQQFLDEAYGNLKVNLNQADSIYKMLQNNGTFIGYLGGYYTKSSELVYNYKSDIQPVLSFALISAPFINKLQIYKQNTHVLSLDENIFDIDALSTLPQLPEIMALPTNQGLWTVESISSGKLPELSYYRNIYNDSYTDKLGTLRVILSGQILSQFAEMTAAVNNEINMLFLNEYGAPLLQVNDTQISMEEMQAVTNAINSGEDSPFILNDYHIIVNTVNLKEIGLHAASISHTEIIVNDLRRKQITLVFFSAASLLLLSYLYYLIASSVARQIIRLSRHMKHINEENLQPYTGNHNNDEIGSLVLSYNSLIARVNELIHTVQQEQILKKEAEIKMLQAQIKPHFLYNTLESMRMLARINNDRDVERMAYSLGALMRYSLSSEQDITSLDQELKNVEHYIFIQKIRMGERLQFTMMAKGDFTTFNCPRFILQPLVENCIIHGLADFMEIGVIVVMVEELENEIRITIEDNGHGIPEERLQEINAQLNHEGNQLSSTNHKSIGLKNVNERIRAFYGENSGIEIVSSRGMGTVFIISLKTGLASREEAFV
jgi:two-component system sensor histidine kinase YesM